MHLCARRPQHAHRLADVLRAENEALQRRLEQLNTALGEKLSRLLLVLPIWGRTECVCECDMRKRERHGLQIAFPWSSLGVVKWVSG